MTGSKKSSSLLGFIPPVYDMERLYTCWKESYQAGWVPVIYGPTATGKTALSIYIARKLADQGQIVEIISADSRQVYRGMDIGTDKVDPIIRRQIIHHMIDCIDPDEIFTAGQWQQEVYKLIPEIQSRGHIPMIVGGTGLYIDAVIFDFTMGLGTPDWEYRNVLEKQHYEALNNGDTTLLRRMLDKCDPKEAMKHHPSSTRFIIRALELYHQTGIPKSQLVTKSTPRFPLQLIGLQQDRDIGNNLIDMRIEQMLDRGLLSEVEGLLNAGWSPNSNALKTIDYRQTIDYLMSHGRMSYDEYVYTLQVAHHQLAKKQRTWFRRYTHLFMSGNQLPMMRYTPIHMNDMIL
ncbi:MAG TPA: tRNA (adenosine(37)-N6)-dimethylallyltransferase MiaA [Candidatus Absconditabacterales bacterium]|nr:tRNA (adenosine(37)-N6)-dimethylallyltransferase MiaA [Candidatus Absconditabacterales bacterium]HNG97102.1 tRNA (adenosine(37)-N6)-dimethylallyltransferase MiaA [Candidatus Absconditabacterales bacterium]